MSNKSLVKMLIGAGVTVLGIIACFVFIKELKGLILGGIGPLLILVGLVAIAVSKE